MFTLYPTTLSLLIVLTLLSRRLVGSFAEVITLSVDKAFHFLLCNTLLFLFLAHHTT